MNIFIKIAICIFASSSVISCNNKVADTNSTTETCTFEKDSIHNTNDHDSIINNMVIHRENGLIIYYPQYKSIDLVCDTMPSPNDNTVLMCCEAAFTGQLLEQFDHMNIAGNHVSNGVFHKGYSCKANTGCFAWYADNKTWKFAIDDYIKYIKDAAIRGGMAFGQVMLIHNRVKQTRPAQKAESRNYYRVLAEYKDQLCIIDSDNISTYNDFVNNLLDIGVQNALYLDMGTGWNYSFYRNNKNQIIYIHDKRIKYTTNWIVFRR